MATRKEALSLGLARYTGRPCTEGHTERYTSSGQCVQCDRGRLRAEWKDPVQRERRDRNSKEFRSSNREYLSAYMFDWQRKNKERVCFHSAKSRASLIQRTPAWSELDEIKEFYDACPPGHHVDHIIPLQGKTVSGLHVLSNLQYLPALENLMKGNRYAP